MAFNLSQKVNITNAASSVDALYGPYDSIDEALETIPEAYLETDEFVGRTIGVYNDEGKVVDYKYQVSYDASGNTTYAFEEIIAGAKPEDLEALRQAIQGDDETATLTAIKETLGEPEVSGSTVFGALDGTQDTLDAIDSKIGSPAASGNTVFSQVESVSGKIGTSTDDKDTSTIFGKLAKAIYEIQQGGSGSDSKWSKWTAAFLGNPDALPAEYAELTETECGTIVDTLAGQMMHADEDGEVDYLYALQMGYPDHEFSSAELAAIKAARDAYWAEHPIDN